MKMEIETAAQFFDEFYGGSHHYPSPIKIFGEGYSINHYGDLSTFDFNHLTRLVIMAHKHCIRVGIQPSSPRCVKITLHQRKRNGSNYERHPELSEAIETGAR